jgi:hypothetical protein
MVAPERLNVLLSRARNALVLVGNSETFLASRVRGCHSLISSSKAATYTMGFQSSVNSIPKDKASYKSHRTLMNPVQMEVAPLRVVLN